MMAYAIAGLVPGMGARVEGSVRLDGRADRLSDGDLQDIRGGRIAMIFQTPFSSLNSVFRVGDVFLRTLGLRGDPKAAAREWAAEAMRSVASRPTSFEAIPTNCRAARRIGWRLPRPSWCRKR
jgi:ABC-type glutathione transport system ATPase component